MSKELRCVDSLFGNRDKFGFSFAESCAEDFFFVLSTGDMVFISNYRVSQKTGTILVCDLSASITAGESIVVSNECSFIDI